MAIKQGTTSKMPVFFQEINMEDVDHIEFLFKRECNPDAEAFKTAKYPDNASRVDGKNTILVPWTIAETYLVPGGELFYMDTRIHLIGTPDMPATNICHLRMSPTLFAKDEVV